MIEIMCRDGTVDPEMLEHIADYVRAVVNDDIEVLHPDDIRAMVFWGPNDVSTAIKDIESSVFDGNDVDTCKAILEDAEPDIHRAMLEAGRDELNQFLLGLEESVIDDETLQ